MKDFCRRETTSARNSRLRHIEAFERFKNMLPGFSATINGFEDKPDLMEGFVGIVVTFLFAWTLCTNTTPRLLNTYAMHVARTFTRSAPVEYDTSLVTTLSPNDSTLLSTHMATRCSVDGTIHRLLVPSVRCIHLWILMRIPCMLALDSQQKCTFSLFRSFMDRCQVRGYFQSFHSRWYRNCSFR